MSLNVCTFMGRLTRTPELKTTGTGVSVCSFSLAVDRNYSKGEKKSDFLDFTAWRGTAEFIANYFHKGDMIAVVTECQTRDWTDKDGNKRKAVEFIVNNASFCGGKSSGGNSADVAEPGADFVEISDDEPLPF